MKAKLLQEVLLQSALRYPERAAVEFLGNVISYAALDKKSTDVSILLKKAGCKPGQIIAIWLTKSIDSIVSLFGILKAGCVYIPLDPDYCPESRALTIISQSNATAIISKSSLITGDFKNRITAISGIMVVLYDVCCTANQGDMFRDNEEAVNNKARHDDEPIKNQDNEVIVHEDDLAYILYTSGSTGTPKGVMITHRNALSFIYWAFDLFKPSHNDIFANHAPFHFDLSVFDIFVTMITGASVHLIPFAIKGNPRQLVRWVNEHKITIWYSVPTVWVSIFNYARINKEDFNQLKLVLFAGEVFPRKYLEKLMQTIPKADFYNLYGPTETNVCTWYCVTAEDLRLRQSVPIGKACYGTEVIVLDEHLNEVTVGGKGMLYVKGPTVTPGYYNNPLATMAAFINSPLERHSGSRIYRTGDIVKRIDQSTYEYIGRDDLMVKCSGYRVELSEIENVLYQYEYINEAVVVTNTNPEQGNCVLHAFIVINNPNGFSIPKLKKFLAQSLPQYMVPEAIEIVEELPKNSNGKIDRKKIAEAITSKSN